MGLGGVAIAILPSIMCLKLTFSDGLGGDFCSIFGAERNNNRLLRSLLAIIMPLNERGKRTDYTKLIQ